MNGEYCEIPKEIIERETQELSDLLTELIRKAEELKRRLGNSNRDSNSLGGMLIPPRPIY